MQTRAKISLSVSAEGERGKEGEEERGEGRS
jgi:hypothetical protein